MEMETDRNRPSNQNYSRNHCIVMRISGIWGLLLWNVALYKLVL